MKEVLYEAVTADEYELPLVVSNRREVVAEYLGIDPRTLSQKLSRPTSGKYSGYRVVRLEIEEEETA